MAEPAVPTSPHDPRLPSAQDGPLSPAAARASAGESARREPSVPDLTPAREDGPDADLGAVAAQALDPGEDESLPEPAPPAELPPALPPQPASATRDPRKSIRRNVRFAVLVVFGLGGSVTAWACFAPLASAIIAPGSLIVESNVKKVQHPTGGVVGELNVEEGAHVDAGQVLLRLDDTQLKARRRVIQDQLIDALARRARLVAERDGADAVAFPREVLDAAASDEEARRTVDGQRRLFETRRANREGQRAQLKERIGQLGQEHAAYEAQMEAARRQNALADKELEVAEEMFRRNLALRDRIFNSRRLSAQLDGQIGSLQATMAQNRGKASETELQILQLDKDFDAKVAEELREVEGKAAELEQRRIEADDLLQRTDVKAPIAGFVYQLVTHTVGGVVSPTEPMMLIVPEADALIVEAKASPTDIDQLAVGQSARLRFSAFNQHTTPELAGHVFRISANRTEDQQRGVSYYTVGLTIDKGEVDKLRGLKLVAGMPVEAFFTLGDRTMMSYLLKPLTDQMRRTFIEK